MHYDHIGATMKENGKIKVAFHDKLMPEFFYLVIVQAEFGRKAKRNFSKNIFDFTTVGDRDCVPAIEHLHALHYSVYLIFLSFGIMDSIVEH